jgi:hypothetical protein
LLSVILCQPGDVPQPRGLVAGRGDDALAVGAEGGGHNPILVAGERGERLPRLRVPYASGLVAGGGDDAPAVGAEGGVKNRECMPGERSDELERVSGGS